MERTRIGHYTLVSELGRGGMGVVYKAHEESLNRYVALKVLGEQLAADPSFVARFVREAQAAAALNHPNIVQIFFIGEDKGLHYFVMEYVAGRTLLTLVREQGRIPKERAAQFMLQAAQGLAAAHDLGLIHRDIKPSNLMLNEHGVVKIADFGLALPQDALTRLTVSGLLVGTPGYLSPEQCRGEKPDPRSDIYSLGVTFYEILTGRLPFQGDSPLALIRQILDEEPPDIAVLAGDIDGELRSIVHRMIAKDPAQRFRDCHTLATALTAYLNRHGTAAVAAGAPLAAAGLPAPAVAWPAPSADFQAELATKPIAPVTPGPQVGTVPSPPPGPPPLDVAAKIVPAPPVAPMVRPAAARPVSPRGVAVAVVVLLVVAVALMAGALALVRHPLVTRVLPVFGAAGSNTASSRGVEAGSAAGEELGTAGDQANAGSSEQGAASFEEGRSGQESSAEGSSAVGAGGRGPTVRTEEAPSSGAGSTRRSGQVRRLTASAVPGVVVAAVGEEALSAVVAAALAKSLTGLGTESADAAALPSLAGSLEDASAAGTVELLRSARAEGIGLLVLARVEPVGERLLQYMGRQDVAYRSRVAVTCYEVATGQPRGAPADAELEYTALNRSQVVERAVGDLARQITDRLQ